jgi:signal peptidase I
MMQKEAPRIPSRAAGGVVETIKTVVWAVAIAVVIRTVAFEPFTIPSGSMIPTLLIGDFVFVSKFSYGYSRWSFPFGLAPFDGRVLAREPERGDVVVFRLPSNTSMNYIKRLVGLPGDRIQVREGVLYLNGAPVPRRRDPACDARAIGAEGEKGFAETLPGGREYCVLQATEHPEGQANNTVEMRVPSGHYFFMGDNRDNSLDSRFAPSQWDPERGGVGFVPAANLVGRADLIWFSIAWAANDWDRGNGVVSLMRNVGIVLRSLPSIRFRRLFSLID